MNAEAKKLLLDVLESGWSLQILSADRSFAEYEAERQFRRANEREFGIIGEALKRLARVEPSVAERIAGSVPPSRS